jgi:hypothetical protein
MEEYDEGDQMVYDPRRKPTFPQPKSNNTNSNLLKEAGISS